MMYNSSSAIFPALTNLKCCNPNNDGCVCGDEEIIIRNYSNGHVTQPMTEEQRKWCIDQTLWAGEGTWKESELTAMSDKELAYCTLRAWCDYANSMY